MRYELRQTTDEALVNALFTLCMPLDIAPAWVRQTMWACHAEDGTPVAYCSASVLANDSDTAFLSSAGVLPCARGHKLQQRMIKARVRWARMMGCTYAITYTVYDNWASITNLLKQGFQFYDPHYRWAGKNVHYFIKEIKRA